MTMTVSNHEERHETTVTVKSAMPLSLLSPEKLKKKKMDAHSARARLCKNPSLPPPPAMTTLVKEKPKTNTPAIGTVPTVRVDLILCFRHYREITWVVRSEQGTTARRSTKQKSSMKQRWARAEHHSYHSPLHWTRVGLDTKTQRKFATSHSPRRCYPLLLIEAARVVCRWSSFFDLFHFSIDHRSDASAAGTLTSRITWVNCTKTNSLLRVHYFNNARLSLGDR